MCDRLSTGGVIALALLGCSDGGDATPAGGGPSARGGVYVTLAPTASGSCPSQGHSKSIGVVPPSFTSPGETIGDGEAGASVACSVTGSTTFSLSARIAQAGTELTLTGEAPGRGIGSGLVEYTDDVIGIQLSSPESMPCTIQTHDEPMQASPGSVFAQLSCSILGGTSSECSLAGTFVFDGCAGGSARSAGGLHASAPSQKRRTSPNSSVRRAGGSAPSNR
jgi:hypothetical protein